VNFTNNIVKLNLACDGHFSRGSSGSSALLLLEGNLKERQEDLEGHGLMACCNGHRKTSVTNYLLPVRSETQLEELAFV